MEYEDQMIHDAIVGRVGADRMALGLPCIPDPVNGDLEVVLKLREENNELKILLRTALPFIESIGTTATDDVIFYRKSVDMAAEIRKELK
jgi:uncharacterized membrane protein